MRTTIFSKTLFKLAFLLITVFSAAPGLHAQQQIEIVIVGSSHGNSGPAAAYRPILEKLKKYKPDMVFGEYLAPEDNKEAIANGYWNAAKDEKKRAYLLKMNSKTSSKLPREIEKGYQLLSNFAYYHRTRMHLARNLFLNYDRANAEYQLYVLEQHMQKRFGKSEQVYFDRMLGGVDSLRSIGLIRKNSEYQKIFFPLMYELGQDKIYAMDCQKYDKPWMVAWAKADSLIKVMEAAAKADSTSAAGLTVKKREAYYKEGSEKMQAAKLEGYDLFNSALYAEMDAAWNFYGGRKFLGAPAFPTEVVQEMLYWWEMRNKGICENIIRQAKEKGATKLVVGVGASHREGMEAIFAQMPEVKLLKYKDLP